MGTYWNTTASQFPQASIKGVIPEQPFNSSQYGLDANDFFADFGTTTIFAGSGGASACATGTPAVPLQVGGTCAGYQKPPWQTGAGVPNDGVRDLPDVSLFAAGDSNFSFYPICAVDGDCQTPTGNNLVQISGVSGTSASVQAFAGIMALVNQKYGRQGQANFVLYPLKAQFPAAFHDVTNGTNSVPCEFAPNLTPNCISVTSPIMVTDPILGQVTEGQIGSGSTGDYAAAAGYNLATGLGTIDANVLVTDWGNIKFAGTTVNLTSPTAGTNVSHGTSVNFAGTVSGDATPTGSVAIETDGVVPVNPSQSTAVLPLSGTGSFSALINYLPGGTYNVWASYGGDGTNAASSSPKVQITVTPEASTTAFNVLNQVTGAPIVSGASNILYGTQLILDAQPVPTTCVNANNCSTANFTTPTGTVTFSDSGSVINTAVVNSTGEAEFNHSWSIGQHSVTAAYSGDASYNASNASAITFSIAKDPPVIFLSSSALLPSGNVQGGQATVFTIQVENSTGQVSGFSNLAAPPTGNVGLTGLPPGVPTSAVLQPGIDPSTDSSEGVATITAPANTPAGTYNNVKINYNGDSNYSSASAGPFSVTIAGLTGLASTTAASTTGSISPTTSITVNGTVTGQSGHGAPTGAVLFFSSGFVLFQVPISPGTAPSVASSFSATLNSQNLLQGANLITVQYLGDAVYSESSTTLSVASPLSDFSMVPMATIVPVSGSGSVAMDTVNVYSVNGFSGMVSFTCAPAFGIACPSPSAVTLSSGGKAAITLNISASGPSFAVSGPAMPVSVAAGSSGAATVTVTPSGGGTATGNNNILLTATAGSFVHTLAIDAFVLSPVQAAVQVSCPPATLPPGVTCPNPLNLTVTSSGAVMGQLTVNVAAPSQAPATAELLPATRTEYASLQGGPRSRNGWWKLSAGTGLAAVFLFFLPGRRRYRTTLGLWLICVLSFAMGCGGGGSGGGGGGPTATTTKITAPVTKAAKGTGLNFNVAVTASGMPAGNGMVQLLDGGNVVTTVAAANGVANFTNITSLSVGTHAISANYQGDASTAASQSGRVNVTVTGTTTVGISTVPASSNNNVTFNLTIS